MQIEIDNQKKTISNFENTLENYNRLQNSVLLQQEIIKEMAKIEEIQQKLEKCENNKSSGDVTYLSSSNLKILKNGIINMGIYGLME